MPPCRGRPLYYPSVIDKYPATKLDFDIEGGAVSDQASITRRDQALKALKAANPGLVISCTLPVLPTGLVSTGVNILDGGCANRGYASPTCSGIAQSNYKFSGIFEAFQ